MKRVSRRWFDEFVAETRGELTSYLCKILPLRDDALEVSQEAYLNVFVALRRASERDHAPKALLYTTARNLAVSRLRHQQIVNQSSVAVGVNQELQVERRTPEQHASKNESMQSLLSVLNMLPPKCREVMLLRMIHGKSQKEIARQLDIAVSTVEKHLSRGLQKCRKMMRENGHGAEQDQRDRCVLREAGS